MRFADRAKSEPVLSVTMLNPEIPHLMLSVENNLDKEAKSTV